MLEISNVFNLINSTKLMDYLGETMNEDEL